MAEGEVLFERGKDEGDEDIWDDTALIKAYDEAVSLMKKKAAEQNGFPVTEDILDTHSSKKKKRKRGRSKKLHKWKVGDRCRARFSEDSCLYEAEILSIDESAETCFVRYVDYGNEEEHALKDLLHAHKHKHKHVQESENETDSGMDWRSHGSRPASRSASHPSMPPPSWPGSSHEFKPPLFPGPMFPGMMGMPSPAGQFTSAPRIPFMPPPPPPPMVDSSNENNEAMCSMLMAWYMSGYHTGYYQGLMQGKKDASTGSPFVNR